MADAIDTNIKGVTGNLLYVKDCDRDTCDVLSNACDLECVIAAKLPLPPHVVEACTCYSLASEHAVRLRGTALPHLSCT